MAYDYCSTAFANVQVVSVLGSQSFARCSIKFSHFFLKNKEFIYRGNEYEKLETFQCHFLSEFSDATIMTTNSPPTDEIKMADVQCILILSSYNGLANFC